MEGAGRRLERHADVGNAKLRGRGRHAYSARPCRSTDSPIPGDYIAKAVPAAIAVCVCPRALIGVPRPPADDGKLLPSAQAFGSLVADAAWHPGHHLASTFAALRMGDQRAISAFTKLSNFAGVRSSLVGSDPPRSASRVWTPGSSSAWSSAAASLSMMPFGVPLGAKIPAQMLIR